MPDRVGRSPDQRRVDGEHEPGAEDERARARERRVLVAEPELLHQRLEVRQPQRGVE